MEKSIIVTVVKGESLPISDFSLSPIVAVKVGEQVLETGINTSGTKANPQWNKSFTFQVEGSPTLDLTLYGREHNSSKKGKVLGKHRLTLESGLKRDVESSVKVSLLAKDKNTNKWAATNPPSFIFMNLTAKGFGEGQPASRGGSDTEQEGSMSNRGLTPQSDRPLTRSSTPGTGDRYDERPGTSDRPGTRGSISASPPQTPPEHTGKTRRSSRSPGLKNADSNKDLEIAEGTPLDEYFKPPPIAQRKIDFRPMLSLAAIDNECPLIQYYEKCESSNWNAPLLKEEQGSRQVITDDWFDSVFRLAEQRRKDERVLYGLDDMAPINVSSGVPPSIRIEISDGRRLLDADGKEFAPSIVVTLAAEKHKLPKQPKTQSPVWNETVAFQGIDASQAHHIQFEIIRTSMFGRAHVMFKYYLSTRTLYSNRRQKKPLILIPVEGSRGGSALLNIAITTMNFGIDLNGLKAIIDAEGSNRQGVIGLEETVRSTFGEVFIMSTATAILYTLEFQEKQMRDAFALDSIKCLKREAQKFRYLMQISEFKEFECSQRKAIGDQYHLEFSLSLHPLLISSHFNVQRGFFRREFEARCTHIVEGIVRGQDLHRSDILAEFNRGYSLIVLEFNVGMVEVKKYLIQMDELRERPSIITPYLREGAMIVKKELSMIEDRDFASIRNLRCKEDETLSRSLIEKEQGAESSKLLQSESETEKHLRTYLSRRELLIDEENASRLKLAAESSYNRFGIYVNEISLRESLQRDAIRRFSSSKELELKSWSDRHKSMITSNLQQREVFKLEEVDKRKVILHSEMQSLHEILDTVGVDAKAVEIAVLMKEEHTGRLLVETEAFHDQGVLARVFKLQTEIITLQFLDEREDRVELFKQWSSEVYSIVSSCRLQFAEVNARDSMFREEAEGRFSLSTLFLVDSFSAQLSELQSLQMASRHSLSEKIDFAVRQIVAVELYERYLIGVAYIKREESKTYFMLMRLILDVSECNARFDIIDVEETGWSSLMSVRHIGPHATQFPINALFPPIDGDEVAKSFFSLQSVGRLQKSVLRTTSAMTPDSPTSYPVDRRMRLSITGGSRLRSREGRDTLGLDTSAPLIITNRSLSSRGALNKSLPDTRTRPLTSPVAPQMTSPYERPNTTGIGFSRVHMHVINEDKNDQLSMNSPKRVKSKGSSSKRASVTRDRESHEGFITADSILANSERNTFLMEEEFPRGKNTDDDGSDNDVNEWSGTLDCGIRSLLHDAKVKRNWINCINSGNDPCEVDLTDAKLGHVPRFIKEYHRRSPTSRSSSPPSPKKRAQSAVARVNSPPRSFLPVAMRPSSATKPHQSRDSGSRKSKLPQLT